MIMVYLSYKYQVILLSWNGALEKLGNEYAVMSSCYNVKTKD